MLWKYYLMAGEFVGGVQTRGSLVCLSFVVLKLPTDYTMNDKFAINKIRIGRPPLNRVSDFGFLILNVCSSSGGGGGAGGRIVLFDW